MDLSKWSPMTVLTVLVTVIALGAGAVITIVHPETLSFGDYFDDITKVLAALGLAVPLGRGIHFGLRDQNPPTSELSSSYIGNTTPYTGNMTWMPGTVESPQNEEGSDSKDDGEDVPLPPKGHHA